MRFLWRENVEDNSSCYMSEEGYVLRNSQFSWVTKNVMMNNNLILKDADLAMWWPSGEDTNLPLERLRDQS